MTRHTPLLAIVVVTLLLIFASGRAVIRVDPFTGMELLGTGNIHSLDRHGPAARGGLRIGDQVVSMDGREFHASGSLLKDAGIGSTVAVGIRRHGVRTELPITLTGPTKREYVFLVERFVVGLVFFLVSTTILLLRSEDLSVRLFFLLSQSIAMLAFGEILDPNVPLMCMLTDVGRYILAPVVLHFFLTFPRPVSERLRRITLRIGYGSAGILMLFNVAALAQGLDLYAHGIWLIPRAFEVLVLAAALGALFRPHRDAPLSVHRRRRLLIAGMLVGFLPVLITLLTMVTSDGGSLFPYEWSLPALALVPITYGYAVYQSELRQADLILNRSMVYFLISALLLSVYSLLFVALDHLLPADRTFGHVLAGALVVIAGSVLFVPLRRRLQASVDRLFYGGWYDYRSFVQSVSARLGRSVDLDHLLEQLRAAGETMRFQSGALLWPRNASFVPRGSYGMRRSELVQLRLPCDTHISRILQREARPLFRGELTELVRSEPLSPVERKVLQNRAFEYWIPLLSKGLMRSMFVLGPRHGDETLDKEDIAILSTLSAQAGIACENIALLESLRAQLSEVEQVRDELAETQARLAEGREEERLHLARELHDGPVQDLYAMLHELELGSHSEGDVDADLFGSLRTRTQQIARTLRDICIDLRPPLLTDVGLVVAIRSSALRRQEQHPDIEFDLEVIPHSENLPERLQLALFRICQEATNNAIQHGNPRCIKTRFEVDAEHVVLQVEDDGRGFAVPDRWIELARRGRLGLLGIAERVTAIGGELDVRSSPGKGTRIRVVVPTPDESHITDKNTLNQSGDRHADYSRSTR